MLDTRLRKNLDIPLLLLTYALAVVGVFVIFSATHDDPSAAFYKKQILWIVLGTFGLAGAALLDYHVYARFSRHFYILNLLLLGVVMHPHFRNKAVNGAARWIKIGGFQLQPSEFAKLFVIITLAVYLTQRRDTIRDVKTLLSSFGYILLPFLMILRQPDLGTALVILAIWFGMVFMAGAKWQHLAVLFLTGVVLFAGLWVSGKGIKQYQKDRLEVFLNAESEKSGTGYHVWQARIAIGSGGLWGKGFLRGTQVHSGYIPEKQTDFAFTTVGEEWGFVGSVALTVVLGLLLLRGAFVIAASDEDLLGKLIATGIVTMLAFHIIENIGMNIGIMPVAGVPLPLISSGGSNMLTTLLCIGLLQSVVLHRHQLLF